jgi:hypothetical protein
MSWFRKPKTHDPSHTVSLEEKPIPDPEKQLSAALSEYEKHFYDKVRAAPDRDAEEAKRVVAEARRFVSESRLGYALARPLLGHIKYWPSWSKRDDFGNYANGPFKYIDGSHSDQKPKTTVVSFTYNSIGYTLRFIDEGMFEWASDDMNAYGKLELIKDERVVLGINVSEDLSKGDAAYWGMTDVYALRPGPWMKDLIEMGAYIDGMEDQKLQQWQNNDAIARAKQIALPESN